jgi:hypothetical protein
MKHIGIGFLRIAPALFAGALAAQEIPLRNWTVPPYTSSSTGGIHTMVDQTPPRAFIGLPPCRLLDTRPGTVFPLDGDGAYAANEARNYTLWGACGIPTGADAVSLNISVTNTQANPFGFIKAWPQGGAEPTVSTLNWTAAGQTLANAAIVPLSGAGGISVRSGNAGTDLIIDVNGYFSDTLGTPNSFLVVSPVPGDGAISGINTSNANGTAGVKGMHGAAVTGATSEPPAGLVGTSPTFDGVLGITQGGSGGAAVRGVRLGVTPPTSGELGTANLGGLFHNDVEIVDGDLRVTQLDLLSRGDIEADGNVTIAGNLQVSGGTKNFVEPHPTDPSKVVQYVSLEGPESGTYFRGRGRFQNGLATIRPAEDFRIVTDPEGLSVQITPIGEMATCAVVRIGLEEIVLKASRNVEFFYMVNGVRRAHKGFQPIADSNGLFVGRGPRSRIPASFPDELRRRLIANGTYNADGTVNVETARRLGWDRIWAEREREELPAARPNP